jgi:preprotein translocase subunit SecF
MKKFDFNIIGHRKKLYIISSVIILLGLSLLLFRGLNLGIDFRSGTILELDLDSVSFEINLGGEFTVADLRPALSPHFERLVFGATGTDMETITVHVGGSKDMAAALTAVQAKWPEARFGAPQVLDVTSGAVRDVLDEFYDTMQIRDLTNTSSVEVRTTDFDDETFPQVMAAIRAIWPAAEATIPVSVDATFSSELVRQAIMALALASLGMLIYIAIRFEYRFAVAAVLALLHDVIIVLAFFAIFRIEVNSEFVAAILTIVGYSINDTIVVFDRIRENLRGSKRQSDFEGLVNRSILETLRRSINTSATTLLAIGAVLFLGGVTLRPLAIALVVGILAGTYSSIFVASSIWVDWKESDIARKLKKA